MIRYRKEGEPIQNGINIYPKDDPGSMGAVTKLGPMLIWTRYSRVLNKWKFKAEIKRKISA